MGVTWNTVFPAGQHFQLSVFLGWGLSLVESLHFQVFEVQGPGTEGAEKTDFENWTFLFPPRLKVATAGRDSSD